MITEKYKTILCLIKLFQDYSFLETELNGSLIPKFYVEQL